MLLYWTALRSIGAIASASSRLPASVPGSIRGIDATNDTYDYAPGSESGALYGARERTAARDRLPGLSGDGELVASKEDIIKMVEKNENSLIKGIKDLEKSSAKKLIKDIDRLSKSADKKAAESAVGLADALGSSAKAASGDADKAGAKKLTQNILIKQNINKVKISTKNVAGTKERSESPAASPAPELLMANSEAPAGPAPMVDTPMKKLTDLFFRPAIVTKTGILSKEDAQTLIMNNNKLKSLIAQFDRIYSSTMPILKNFLEGHDNQGIPYEAEELPKDVMKYQVIEVTEKQK
ncbi:hypothetical protein PAPHI01_2383 [Pancytospora philotis]|nr:hypothetical protein PAPHI01_2383 [Pancytospora philotis]